MKYTMHRTKHPRLLVIANEERSIEGRAYQHGGGDWTLHPRPYSAVTTKSGPSLAALLIDAGFEGYVEVEE